MNRLFASGVLVLLGGVGVGAAGGSAAFAQEGKEPSRVTEFWAARCADCHGGGGAGVQGKAATLLTDQAMDESKDRPFFEMLRKGEGAHGSEAIKGLTEQQTWSLIVHLRELQHDAWRKRVGDPKPDSSGVFASQRAKFKVETVYEKDFKTPWSIEWLPVVPPAANPRNGNEALPKPARVLVTEKDGQLNVYEGTKHMGVVKGLPKLVSNGQGGLMDVAAHPDYVHNGWIYLSFAEAGDGNREMTKIVRGKLSAGAIRNGVEEGFEFTDQQVIFQPRPGNYNGAGVHYGSRIVFQKPGADVTDAKGRYYVYFSIGERGGMEQAQQLNRPNGKNHRLWDDGTVPSDNPYASSTEKDVYPSIWSKGHRNQQGVCFDDNGTLWVTEHGPRGGDELNLITKGANYGWPQVCFGINYQDTPFVIPWKEKATDGTPITMPVHRWIKSIAACGLDCARSANVKTTFPDWSGDLFAGGLAGQNVDRLRVKDGVLVEREEIVHGMGRVRDVAFGPDGFLYLVLNSPDKVVRLVPAK